ncbi:MAG: C40 family peptidase [Microbacteriaceae bacterium]|nr:C40 family peptidase [Microbacteriaceae bacterium]
MTIPAPAAPLTRREAREIERRTGVRPVAGATAADFRHDTGEIERNELTALVSVLPTSLLARVDVAPEAPAAEASATDVPEAFDGRGLTVRAAMPASLVAARRRRTAGGVAAAASVAALATAGMASTDGAAIAEEHRASLLSPTLETDAAPPAEAADADSLAPAPQVAADEQTTVIESVDASALFGAAAQEEIVEEPLPASDEADADWGDDSGWDDSGWSDEAPAAPAAAPASGSSGSILGIAEQYLGVPYVWGGTTPSGFDCSGYVAYVLNQAGYNATTSISQLASLGTPTSNPKPGDLVVYGNYHIGFYAGPNSLLHAPYEGRTVEYGNMDWAPHYFISLN